MPDTFSIPLNRQYFHDKIENEKKKCDKIDGKIDGMVTVGKNEEINIRVTDVLYREVNQLQEWVEKNEAPNNEKIRQLSYIEGVLGNFRYALSKKQILLVDLPALIGTFDIILKSLNSNNYNILPFIEQTPYGIANVLTETFSNNQSYNDAKKLVYLKYCKLHPEEIITTIRPYAMESFADSLIFIACKNNPSKLYTYAQSVVSPEGRLIHQSKIPLVKAIATLSQMSNALMYFPFLDNIISGKYAIDNIQQYVGSDENSYDSIGYYRLLVSTEIDYYRRMTSPSKDTPIAMFGPNGLRDVLKDRAIRHFITPINVLHEENNLDIRMRAIDSLSPVDLYMMMVMGEDEIYTSSFKHSFNRMIQRLGTAPKSDSLLLAVRFDFFKKFIKMSANYNKLDTFLKRMNLKNAQVLMKAFVANLDAPESLEDATDVADSYSSINEPKLKKTILKYVIENEQDCIKDNNENGKIVYSLLKNIFLSEDSLNKIDLSKIAGISSVYEVANKTLEDDSGRIVEQVFFYGDEDGKTFFPLFLNSFSLKDWRLVQNSEWVELKSNKGNVWIYANKPLDYDANLDDSAQSHLIQYLSDRSIKPSIVVHRGHSYWLPGTIQRMPDDVKVVLLGSCGGYKNLSKILQNSPHANIISTKEIGAGDINKPIMNYLHQALIHDNTINWKQMWASLTRQFKNDANPSLQESWENYVPPYKNLGAIFIKAYKMKTDSL